MKQKIFIDLDGVLSDFFSDWRKLTGEWWYEMKDINNNLDKIRNTKNFWINLPLLQNGKKLINFLKKNKLSYSILSAPLLNDQYCIKGKKQWVENNLSFHPPEKIIISCKKENYAKFKKGHPNILIDDFGKNIEKWQLAGGFGIKHKEWKFSRTIRKLENYLI